MPHYRFEIADGVRLADPVGLECQDDGDARCKPEVIAHRIADHGTWSQARCVVVLDERGREIYKTPIKRDGPA
ncbi:MAG: hypothetical protein QOJ86_4999 [Bradyrhizobium sp.]|jgi:hypothetical protein|nr:hypothetical protein [Bradyrhizobium sp.]